MQGLRLQIINTRNTEKHLGLPWHRILSICCHKLLSFLTLFMFICMTVPIASFSPNCSRSNYIVRGAIALQRVNVLMATCTIGTTIPSFPHSFYLCSREGRRESVSCSPPFLSFGSEETRMSRSFSHQLR